MPFTGSHPAAVLPLLRTPLPSAALVIGSLAPDLPYYLPGRPDIVTHTATALLSTDVLVGLGAWLVWVLVLERPVRAVAPRRLAARLPPAPTVRERLGSPVRVVLVLLAVAVGAGTHVGWDEFTHPGRFGDRHVPLLAEQLGPIAGHQWAQYLSSVVGLVVLAVWAVRWWTRTPQRTLVVEGWRPGRSTLLVVAAAAVATGALAVVLSLATRAGEGAPTVRQTAFTACTSFGGGVLAVLAVAALGWHVRGRRLD